MAIDELIKRAQDALTVRRVYGEPFQLNGVTIIPAANVRGGWGGGGGSGTEPGGGRGEGEGTGGGLSARPVGAFVIENGQVRWKVAFDLNRIVLGGQIVAIAYFVTSWLIERSRARHRRRSRSGVAAVAPVVSLVAKSARRRARRRTRRK